MNCNRTHRLTIVDKKHKIYQIKRAETKTKLQVAKNNNTFNNSQDRKKAA